MSKPIETRCIHGNSDFRYQDPTKAVSFPIYQTATFGHIGVGQSTGYDYTRVQNPTRERLEETISALEGACDTVAFSTGMAAVSACFELFGAGDHIICSEDLYGGATRLLQTIGQKTVLRWTLWIPQILPRFWHGSTLIQRRFISKPPAIP